MTALSRKAGHPNGPPLWQRHNLPAARTRLIGREQDSATGRDLLLQAPGRLVTLTGPGGCGKTHLALRVASELAPGFPNGVWVVDLAAVRESELVPYAVAAALGRRGRARQTIEDSLVASLGVGHEVLLLDNGELLTDACASLRRASVGRLSSSQTVGHHS